MPGHASPASTWCSALAGNYLTPVLLGGKIACGSTEQYLPSSITRVQLGQGAAFLRIIAGAVVG